MDILGSIFSATFLAAILRVTTPILLPSLGALVSDRAGVINIGLEGIMLSAAFSGSLVSGLTSRSIPELAPFIGLIAGLTVAMLMALLLAVFHLRFNGDLILGGIAINILGASGTVAIGMAITGDTSGSTRSLTPISQTTINLSFLQGIPGIGDFLYTTLGNQNIMTWIAFILVVVVWFVLYRMPFGKHLRAVGENQDAAASVGINVKRVRYIALALSGLLAGLGGIYLSMGYISAFGRDMTAGRGYIALVAPALGNGKPLGTMLAAILFGVFEALSVRVGSADIPSQFPRMIPYLATILALIFYAIQRRRALALKRTESAA
jgi:general nucleoside transport system permease protein